jgi:hypothetical protein
MLWTTAPIREEGKQEYDLTALRMGALGMQLFII